MSINVQFTCIIIISKVRSAPRLDRLLEKISSRENVLPAHFKRSKLECESKKLRAQFVTLRLIGCFNSGLGIDKIWARSRRKVSLMTSTLLLWDAR